MRAMAITPPTSPAATPASSIPSPPPCVETLFKKQRNYGRRQDERPQDAESADLTVGSEVGFQYGSQDQDVDNLGV